jgi:hypothetical protein
MTSRAVIENATQRGRRLSRRAPDAQRVRDELRAVAERSVRSVRCRPHPRAVPRPVRRGVARRRSPSAGATTQQRHRASKCGVR